MIVLPKPLTSQSFQDQNTNVIDKETVLPNSIYIIIVKPSDIQIPNNFSMKPNPSSNTLVSHLPFPRWSRRWRPIPRSRLPSSAPEFHLPPNGGSLDLRSPGRLITISRRLWRHAIWNSAEKHVTRLFAAAKAYGYPIVGHPVPFADRGSAESRSCGSAAQPPRRSRRSIDPLASR